MQTNLHALQAKDAGALTGSRLCGARGLALSRELPWCSQKRAPSNLGVSRELVGSSTIVDWEVWTFSSCVQINRSGPSDQDLKSDSSDPWRALAPFCQPSKPSFEFLVLACPVICSSSLVAVGAPIHGLDMACEWFASHCSWGNSLCESITWQVFSIPSGILFATNPPNT